jgi:cyclase
VRDGAVVKGVQFRNHRIVGDILELAERYCAEGADELVFYDITASPDSRMVDRDWVSNVARVLDIPFCVAGGMASSRWPMPKMSSIKVLTRSQLTPPPSPTRV